MTHSIHDAPHLDGSDKSPAWAPASPVIPV